MTKQQTKLVLAALKLASSEVSDNWEQRNAIVNQYDQAHSDADVIKKLARKIEKGEALCT